MCTSDKMIKYLDKVGEMSDNGYSEEYISEKLNLSIDEVRTIIKFYNF